MKNGVLCCVAMIVLLSLCSPINAVTRYKITNLGNAGGTCSWPQAISENGMVAGYFQTSSGTCHACVWQGGKVRDLGGFGSASTYATGINNSGQVCGRSSDGHALFWDSNGVVTDIGKSGTFCHASAINNQGHVVGKADGGFIWKNGTRTMIAGATCGLNDLDQVTGTTGSTKAFLWENGHTNVIGTLPGVAYSHGWGINDSGEVVGTSGADLNYGRAFLWKNGTMTDLGTLGGNHSVAYDINGCEQIVGMATVTDSFEAFLWESGHMYQLSTLVNGYSGYMGNAIAINDAGQIVGYGGAIHSFLLTPIVPEPSSILALICGLGGLSGMVWRRKR